MADILIHSTVSSVFIPTESASNSIIDTPIDNSHTTNKYNGHVNRLYNGFTEENLTSDNRLSNIQKLTSMTNNREEYNSYKILNRKYSNSEQYYDFPSDVIEQLKKQQQHEDHEQALTHIVPAFLPTNVVKRMNHVKTCFVKPTKIQQFTDKLSFQIDDKQESSKQTESPLISESDSIQDDLDKTSEIFYEKPGLPKLDDDDNDNDNDDTLNDVKRVRFSTAPIRVYPTYSANEYDRRNDDINPFAASAEYELEKRIEKMNVFTVEIEKGLDNLGISILGMGIGADSGLEKLGIFVKSLNPGGIVAKDGRIQVADQLIQVDDHSLVGVTHTYATHVLKNTAGLVKFIVGRAKDNDKAEILHLIQRSLELDKERDDTCRNFEQYHDAYYEKTFDDDDSMQNERIEDKLTNEIQIEILKQCYQALEKQLEKSEKDRDYYQKLYEQILNDFKQIEEKYCQAKIAIKDLQDRENELNNHHDKRVNELMKKIEELERIIALKSTPVPTMRFSSVSSDKLSTNSQLESLNVTNSQQNLLSTNEKLTEQNLTRNQKLKLPAKHLSTTSLGQISNDSEVFSRKTQISLVPSLEQTNNIDYIEIKDWSTDQCIQWLTAQQMSQLIPIFLNRNIDGQKLLLLDSSKMKTIGIKSSKERDQLKSKIKELKHTELNQIRDRLLQQQQQPTAVHTSKRSRSSSLTRLRERRFFSSSSSGK